jgi:hypothetical protein
MRNSNVGECGFSARCIFNLRICSSHNQRGGLKMTCTSLFQVARAMTVRFTGGLPKIAGRSSASGPVKRFLCPARAKFSLYFYVIYFFGPKRKNI